MSMKSESIVYFADGHTEAITDFEITKDGHDIWFTVESGRWFIHKEELVYEGKVYRPEYKFYEVKFNRERDNEFGAIIDTLQLIDTDIERIKLRIKD